MISDAYDLKNGEMILRVPKIDQDSCIISNVIVVFDVSFSMDQYNFSDIVDELNQFVQNSQGIKSTMILFGGDAKVVHGFLSVPTQELSFGQQSIMSGVSRAGTNIFAAIHLLVQTLDKEIREGASHALVVFISDGEDTRSRNLQTKLDRLLLRSFQIPIEFISVAVGRGFPTFVSESLRQGFHSGRVNIPVLYRLFCSETDRTYQETFRRDIPTYFKTVRNVSFGTSVKISPWTPSVQTAYEETLVITKHVDSIIVDGQEFNVVNRVWSIDIICALFTQWIRELHTEALTKKDIRPTATLVLAFMDEITKIFMEDTDSCQQRRMTVTQRLNKILRQEDHQIDTLKAEVRKLIHGTAITELTNAELAKRREIGTHHGKYLDRAHRFAGTNTDAYCTSRDQFVTLIQDQSPLLRSKSSTQEESSISLYNQQGILLQTDLIDGLIRCPSAYHLVCAFPLVGHAVKVRRTDGVQINPWVGICVEEICRVNRVLDSISHTELEEGRIGIGADDVETINAIIPLFSETDDQLVPFLTSSLFNMLMTFNLARTIDVCFPDAHISLMSALFVKLLDEPDSTWRSDTMKLIAETTRMCYFTRGKYKKYCEVLNNPEKYKTALVTDHPDLDTKCESLNKVLVIVWALHGTSKELAKDQVKRILEYACAEYIGRSLRGEYCDVTKQFECDIASDLDDTLLTSLEEIGMNPNTLVQEAFTITQLEKEVNERIMKFDLPDIEVTNVHVHTKTMKWFNEKSQIGMLSIETIRSLFKMLYGETLEIDWNSIVNHACKIPNSYERATSLILPFSKVRSGIIRDIINKKCSQFKATRVEKLTALARITYLKEFDNTHQLIPPMSEPQLRKYFESHTIYDVLGNRVQGTFEEVIDYNQDSGLVRNMCLSPDCPHFMKQTSSLGEHIHTWRLIDQELPDLPTMPFCPAFHLSIRSGIEHNLSDEQIFDAIYMGTYLREPTELHCPDLIKNARDNIITQIKHIRAL